MNRPLGIGFTHRFCRNRPQRLRLEPLQIFQGSRFDSPLAWPEPPRRPRLAVSQVPLQQHRCGCTCLTAAYSAPELADAPLPLPHAAVGSLLWLALAPSRFGEPLQLAPLQELPRLRRALLPEQELLP